jgi:cell wall-associated NlpC family hydrolase
MSSGKLRGSFRAVPVLLMRRIARFEARADAAMDSGFNRADALLERQIISVKDSGLGLASAVANGATAADRALTGSIAQPSSNPQIAQRFAQGLASLAQAADVALDHRLPLNESETLKTTAARLRATSKKFESSFDAQLVKNLAAVDRAVSRCAKATDAPLTTANRVIGRLDPVTERTFTRADQRVTNASNRARHARTKATSFASRNLARLDQNIDSSLAHADAGFSAAFQRSSLVTNSAVMGLATAARAIDKTLGNSVATFDSQVTQSANQLRTIATTTRNLVDESALAFERVMDLGISRIDSGIDGAAAKTVLARKVITTGALNTDQLLDRGLAHTETAITSAMAKPAFGYAKTSGLVANKIKSVDTAITARLVATDASIDTAVATFARAASATARYVSKSTQATDAKLLGGVTAVDQHFGALVAKTSKADSTGKRSAIAPAWAVAGLALVLGTLGTATGTSVITADSAPIEIDNSAAAESLAAKTVVSQYLEVRESFAALQASRSRTIATLETQIATAQTRAEQSTIDANAVLNIARKYDGVPYARAGTTPKGFDCSGFTSYVFRQVGVKLPRTSGSQAAWSDRIENSDRQVGDLMFWANRGGVHHVAIYAGDGMMWDSPRPGRSVGKVKIWGSPFYGRVPVAAINGEAIAEVATKTAELERLKAEVPQLTINVDIQDPVPTP